MNNTLIANLFTYFQGMSDVNKVFIIFIIFNSICRVLDKLIGDIFIPKTAKSKGSVNPFLVIFTMFFELGFVYLWLNIDKTARLTPDTITIWSVLSTIFTWITALFIGRVQFHFTTVLMKLILSEKETQNADKTLSLLILRVFLYLESGFQVTVGLWSHFLIDFPFFSRATFFGCFGLVLFLLYMLYARMVIGATDLLASKYDNFLE